MNKDIQPQDETESHRYHNNLVSSMRKRSYTTSEIKRIDFLLSELTAKGINNLDKFKNKLIHYIPHREQFWDTVFEGNIALSLALSDFGVTFYPFGERGIDLEALWENYLLFIEVSRFREDYNTKAKLEKFNDMGEPEILIPYGRGEKDVEAFHSKIIDEATQLPEDGIGLIILRSDNCRIEEFEYEQAVEYLEEQVLKNDTLRRMSGVLFDSGQVLLSNGKRSYLWCNPRAEKQIEDELHKKLIMLLTV